MEKYGCIYKITNNINNKIYIGKFVYSKKRRFKHYWGSGTALQHAYKKYGRESFSKVVIEEVEGNNSVLCEREIYWISQLDAINNSVGYNISKGGDGYILNEKQRKEMSKRMLNAPKELFIKQNVSRAELRKEGKYAKPVITKEHLKQLRQRQLEMVEFNKENNVYDKIAELNKSEEKIEKQRKTMKKKGAPHLAKTFIFENIITGEKMEVYGGFMDFCDSHNLSRKCMRNIADGKRKEAYSDWIVSRKEG